MREHVCAIISHTNTHHDRLHRNVSSGNANGSSLFERTPRPRRLQDTWRDWFCTNALACREAGDR